MIRTYCQYSYGGFKTFYIEGLTDEHLNPDKEVTLDNPHDFPESAHVFFQYGGSKIVYRKLPDGHLCLAVREIPSNDTDGAGRHINCGVQFIGHEEDRQTLDNIALVIANDITEFSSFFANLFYDIKGLHIEGTKLREFIDQWSKGVKIEGEMFSPLSAIEKKTDGVFLFVPLSDNFDRDKDVTANVCKELRLKKDELKGSVIRFSELMRRQKLLAISPTPQIGERTKDVIIPPSHPKVKEMAPSVNLKEEVPSPPQKVESEPIQQPKSAKDIVTIKKEPEQPRKSTVPAPPIHIDDERIDELKRKLRLYKKIGYGLAAIIAILFITTISRCSRADEKKNLEDSIQIEQIDNSQIKNNLMR